MAKLIKRNGKFYVRKITPIGFKYLCRTGEYWWVSLTYAGDCASFNTQNEAERVWKESKTRRIKTLK